MTTTTELLRQGREDEVWRKYCGFLDLSLEQFMEIQERLLTEQLELMSRSELGRMLMGDDPPLDLEAFRQRVRLTTYEDYAPYLDERREDVLAEKPVAWAHTSGRMLPIPAGWSGRARGEIQTDTQSLLTAGPGPQGSVRPASRR